MKEITEYSRYERPVLNCLLNGIYDNMEKILQQAPGFVRYKLSSMNKGDIENTVTAFLFMTVVEIVSHTKEIDKDDMLFLVNTLEWRVHPNTALSDLEDGAATFIGLDYTGVKCIFNIKDKEEETYEHHIISRFVQDMAVGSCCNMLKKPGSAMKQVTTLYDEFAKSFFKSEDDYEAYESITSQMVDCMEWCETYIQSFCEQKEFFFNSVLHPQNEKETISIA